jgi:hypothetical protein
VDPEPTGPQKQRLGGILATRGRKIGAAVGAAFLAGIGGGIAAWTLNTAEETTKKAFAGQPDAPLQIRVARPGTVSSGHPWAPYYVIPQTRAARPPQLTEAELNSGIAIDEWARGHGGVPGSPGIVRLQLRAATDEPVIVNAIRVNVVDRTDPVQGWFVANPGCGAEPVRIANVDLDASPPTVQYEGSGPPSRQLTLSVTRTDVELVELHASTRKATVDWTAEVFYSGPDGDGSIVVDDAGRPFQVTTETQSEGYRRSFDGDAKLVREPGWDETGISAC